MPITARLGLFYAALFVGSGASAPYIGVWFHAHGLSGAAIGLILAAPLMGRALTGPALAVWADGFAQRRTPLALMGAIVAVSFAGLAVTHGFWPWFVLWFVSQSVFTNMSPLVDVISAAAGAGGRLHHYGWPRGIGSAAYVVANVGMGFVLGVTTPEALLVWITTAALVVAGAARWLLPPDQVHDDGARLVGRQRLKGLGGADRRSGCSCWRWARRV